MTCYLPGSSPSRHFECREDLGDEVAQNAKGISGRALFAHVSLVPRYLGGVVG